MFSTLGSIFRLLQKVWNRSVTVTGRSATSPPPASVLPITWPPRTPPPASSDVERLGIVVAAGAGIDLGRAAELAHPHDQRVVEHAALLQVGEQVGQRLIDLAGQFLDAREVVDVRVPAVEHDFDERDAGFDQPPGQQAAQTELRRP